MRIRLIAIGQKMPSWVEQGYQDYAKRIKGDLRLELTALAMQKRSKNTSASRLCDLEGKSMLASIKPQERIVSLDVKGQAMSTEQLASQLVEWQHQGQSIAWLIGGPDGLSKEVINASEKKISLSNLTLPHPLVRVIVAEQLYRAWSINQGHPYHR